MSREYHGTRAKRDSHFFCLPDLGAQFLKTVFSFLFLKDRFSFFSNRRFSSFFGFGKSFFVFFVIRKIVFRPSLSYRFDRRFFYRFDCRFWKIVFFSFFFRFWKIVFVLSNRRCSTFVFRPSFFRFWKNSFSFFWAERPMSNCIFVAGSSVTGEAGTDPGAGRRTPPCLRPTNQIATFLAPRFACFFRLSDSQAILGHIGVILGPSWLSCFQQINDEWLPQSMRLIEAKRLFLF